MQQYKIVKTITMNDEKSAGSQNNINYSFKGINVSSVEAILCDHMKWLY